jgi:carboxyl-terminal processing protease
LLDKYQNEETPLNIVKYKQMQKEIKEAAKKLDNFLKSPVDLHTQTLPQDSVEIATDTAKISKQNTFLKNIGSDIYVNETVKVLEKVIGEAQIAQANNK